MTSSEETAVYSPGEAQLCKVGPILFWNGATLLL